MNKRLPVLTSFVLFVALCASITYWTMQFLKPAQRPLAAPVQELVMEIPLQVAAGLFGGRAAAVVVASNFQLKGVVFAGNPRDSIAILGTDGKPAQASRVNAEVVPGVTVKEVHNRYVLLSEGGTVKRVELQESAKNGMQIQTPMGQSVGQVSPGSHRQEPPPQMPTQMAPALQPTIVVAPPPPAGQIEPSPNPGQNIMNPPQLLNNGQEAPPVGKPLNN